ncbi:DUF1439 domain-containing protein [Roseateles toxinivorans]|uniref:Uncharacterized protein DUF1439 n=1 Tax=Roseateles toxinivorans TaxID=270368 RepID=A0A4V3CS27_9BURK|nr:DUF1439 domain-containing protein [Roseateles toxinivorans]TDP59052.1 uncharacterized protein DUF1439 [Roseateles toxinivorans]
MTFLFRSSLLLSICIALAACATLGGVRTLTLSEAELNERLQRQLPIERRMLELLEIRLSEPRLQLLPQSNRIALTLAVASRERLSGRAYQGRITIDFALRYDELRQAIRLEQVRVTDFLIDDLPPRQQAQTTRLGSLITEQLLKDLAVYRFKAKDLQAAEGMGYAPGAVTVTARGVEVTLVPRSSAQ